MRVSVSQECFLLPGSYSRVFIPEPLPSKVWGGVGLSAVLQLLQIAPLFLRRRALHPDPPRSRLVGPGIWVPGWELAEPTPLTDRPFLVAAALIFRRAREDAIALTCCWREKTQRDFENASHQQ